MAPDKPQITVRAIPFNQNLNKPQAAFVIFYALDGQPWQDYTNKPDYQRLVIPCCAMINRSDGWIGFIGGKVDSGETLIETAKREVEEEIGHTFEGELEEIVAHDIGVATTHCFAQQVSYQVLRDIQKQATLAKHFGSEITGIFLPHLIDYQKKFVKGGGLVRLIKAQTAPSVREELVHFLLKKNIFNQKELTDICTRAGFSLEELLK